MMVITYGVFVRVLGQLLPLLACAMLCSTVVAAQDKPMHQRVIQYGVVVVAAVASHQLLPEHLSMLVTVALAVAEQQAARLAHSPLVGVVAQTLAQHPALALLVKLSSLSSRRKERT
jgi:hypothetical protein